MKIVHLVLNYYPSIGGTQIFYKAVSENCVSKYHDHVEVLTVDSYYGPHSKLYKKIPISQETLNGVTIKRFSFFRFHRFGFSILNKLSIKIFGKKNEFFERYLMGPWSPSLTYALNNVDADVISASSSGFLYMNYPLYRHKLSNPKPFVYQGAIHFGDNEKDKVISNKTLQSIKASEYYLCNSQYEKNRLVEMGVMEDMIVVTGVGVDMDKFKNGNSTKYRAKFNLSENEILVGYVGRLEATKSIDILIKAFVSAYKQNKQLRLVIGGFESNYVSKLKQIINNLEPVYAKSIYLELNISNEDKVDLFNALDIFVLPSVNESFGIVFLEAWSCKKPVIGTAIGAIKSIISEGLDGLLMQPFDSISLCNNILKLASDQELCFTLGNNGFIKTQENYTWEIVTKKIRDTYSNAINKFNHVQRRSNLG